MAVLIVRAASVISRFSPLRTAMAANDSIGNAESRTCTYSPTSARRSGSWCQ